LNLVRYADDVIALVGKDVNRAVKKLQESILSRELKLSK